MSQPDLQDRFWRKVDKSGDCWLWTGARSGTGYGQLSISSRIVYAHRFSYEVAFGAIPEGMLIQHSCDNRPCVNPSHLSPGTVATNAADMMAKGRHRTAMSRDDVQTLLALRADGVPYRVIADRLGRDFKALRNIVAREGRRGRGEPLPRYVPVVHYARKDRRACGAPRGSVLMSAIAEEVTCRSCGRIAVRDLATSLGIDTGAAS